MSKLFKEYEESVISLFNDFMNGDIESNKLEGRVYEELIGQSIISTIAFNFSILANELREMKRSLK